MRHLLSVTLSLDRPPAQAWSFLSILPPLCTLTPFSRGQVSTQSPGLFGLEPVVCSGGLSPPQLSEVGLLVRVTCSFSSLEYTFSWGPLLAFKDPADTSLPEMLANL